jgi:guanylate kinase
MTEFFLRSHDTMSDASPENEFLMLIVSSPSGAGKTTLCSRLRAEFPDLKFSVSYTTRPPRPTEVDGREYHFVDEDTFRTMISQDAFAEWACVHGRYYGTSRDAIASARQHGGGILFDIDYQGARQLKASYPEVVGVFILPPSLQELERRLRGRGTEDEATTLRRLANAKGEIGHYVFFDYVVVNDDIDQAYGRLRSIWYAEKSRRDRHATGCEKLLAESASAPDSPNDAQED